MLNEGKLTGTRKTFPIKIKKIVGRFEQIIEVENQEKLIELYEKELEDPISKKKKTWQILEEMGIGNEEIGTRQMIDNRTENIIEEYLFYQKNPHQAPYDSLIWKKSVIILNSVLSQGIF